MGVRTALEQDPLLLCRLALHLWGSHLTRLPGQGLDPQRGTSEQFGGGGQEGGLHPLRAQPRPPSARQLQPSYRARETPASVSGPRGGGERCAGLRGPLRGRAGLPLQASADAGDFVPCLGNFRDGGKPAHRAPAPALHRNCVPPPLKRWPKWNPSALWGSF